MDVRVHHGSIAKGVPAAGELADLRFGEMLEDCVAFCVQHLAEFQLGDDAFVVGAGQHGSAGEIDPVGEPEPSFHGAGIRVLRSDSQLGGKTSEERMTNVACRALEKTDAIHGREMLLVEGRDDDGLPIGTPFLGRPVPVREMGGREGCGPALLRKHGSREGVARVFWQGFFGVNDGLDLIHGQFDVAAKGDVRVPEEDGVRVAAFTLVCRLLRVGVRLAAHGIAKFIVSDEFGFQDEKFEPVIEQDVDELQ